MANIYSSLALSYRRWHYRMTTEQLDRRGPAIGFTAMQGLNILSLLILLPIKLMPGWVFVAIPFVGAFGIFQFVCRIYRDNPASSFHAAKLTDSVPGVSEFPMVYAYLLFTLALFVGCLYVAVHSAG